MLQPSTLTFISVQHLVQTLLFVSKAYAHVPGTVTSIARMHAVDRLLCNWTDTQESSRSLQVQRSQILGPPIMGTAVKWTSKKATVSMWGQQLP